MSLFYLPHSLLISHWAYYFAITWIDIFTLLKGLTLFCFLLVLPLQREGRGEGPSFPLRHPCSWWGSLPARSGAKKSQSNGCSCKQQPTTGKEKHQGRFSNSSKSSGQEKVQHQNPSALQARQRLNHPQLRNCQKPTPDPSLPQNHSNSTTRHWFFCLLIKAHLLFPWHQMGRKFP